MGKMSCPNMGLMLFFSVIGQDDRRCRPMEEIGPKKDTTDALETIPSPNARPRVSPSPHARHNLDDDDCDLTKASL